MRKIKSLIKNSSFFLISIFKFNFFSSDIKEGNIYYFNKNIILIFLKLQNKNFFALKCFNNRVMKKEFGTCVYPSRGCTTRTLVPFRNPPYKKPPRIE